MKRNKLNYLIDLLSLLLFCGLVWTGSLIYFILPPGSRSGGGLTLWGLDRHQFGDIHLGLAIALVVALLIHIALHWRWICHTTLTFIRPTAADLSRRTSRIATVIVATLIVLTLLLTLIWARAQVQNHGTDHRGHRFRQSAR